MDLRADVLQLARELIETPSVSTHEAALADRVESEIGRAHV